VGLYLVPTPIGNLKDITLRALETLQQVDVILAEDTRSSGKLLKHYNIKRPLESYHIHNEHNSTLKLIDKMKQGTVYALVTDAGTPAISDQAFYWSERPLKPGLLSIASLVPQPLFPHWSIPAS
jgi:16S rRNA (cytidine1402-2'-O)-methyltransferase